MERDVSQMNTCKTCKHWTVDNDHPGSHDNIINPRDPDTLEPMATGFEVRECAHPAKTFYERPVERNGFGLCDGSEYFAALYTAEDFGCVRHETEPASAKEPE